MVAGFLAGCGGPASSSTGSADAGVAPGSAANTPIATDSADEFRRRRLPFISTFEAAPATIAAGEAATLSWYVTNAVSISIDPDIGTVTGSSAAVSPTTTTTYTLTAKNGAGTRTATATVTVTAPAPAPTAVPPPTITSFSASPTSVSSGQSATLSWSVANATSISIAPGVGPVAGSSVSVSPTATTTYTLTATGNGTATATVSVAVTTAPPTAVALYPADTRMSKQSQPPLAEPPLRGSATFADLGTIVTRAADSPHHYAKDSPWNSDETKALLLNGTVLDATTFVPTGVNILGSVQANEHRAWSNTDPRYVYGAHYQNRQWVRMDATDASKNVVLATYGQYGSVSFGAYEGTIDANDTGVVLVGDGRVPFLVDPKTGAVRCTVTSGGGYGGSVSDTGISQDGQYLLVNWGSRIDAYRASDCSFLRQLTSAGSHYDACVSSTGDQVILQLPGNVVMTRISDGQQTTIYNADSSFRGHVSCRNLKRPGWAYLSLYNDTCDSYQQNMVSLHRVFAVKLDGSQTVENFAWDHQACPNGGYSNDPMAAPSPTGTKVWWKTNWDATSSGVHSFVAHP